MDEALEITSRAEATHFWFRGFRSFIVPVLDQLSAGRRDLRLVDCGCGTGHNLSLLRQYGQAFGFDLTPAGLAYAGRRGVPIARADISHVPFRSATFDVLTSFDVLQYVDDDAQTLREFARVLRPGGGLVITAAAMEMLRGGHAAFWPEVRRYDAARLRRITEGAGLRVSRVSYLFGSLFPMVLAARVAGRLGQGNGAAKDDWEMKVPPAPVNAALTLVLRGEAAVSRYVPMPFGSSLMVVATKP